MSAADWAARSRYAVWVLLWLVLPTMVSACGSATPPTRDDFAPSAVAPKGAALESARVVPTWADDSFPLVRAKKQFRTQGGLARSAGDGPPPVPPPGLFRLVRYPAQPGDLYAYVTPDPGDGRKHPAVLWAHGGFNWGIGEGFWDPAPRDNDQTAAAFREAGVVLMIPSFRGGNDNPGMFEDLYGEVDDYLCAAAFLSNLPYVDAAQIYFSGHSTGATLVLLAAASTDRYREALVFGPADETRNYGEDTWPFRGKPDDEETEWRLRAPIHWIGDIRRPTMIIEGERGNARAALRLAERAAASDAPVQVKILEGANHFDVLRPLSELMAKAILAQDAKGADARSTPPALRHAPEGASGGSPASDEWRVGAFLSLTGREEQFGGDTREGIDLAVQEVNDAGGIRGRRIRVVYADDRSNAQEATNQVLRLIADDRVVALLGEVASSRSRAGGIVANREGIPMITPASTHPEVTKIGPFVFRACFTDDLQGKGAATFVRTGLRKSKVGILYASDDLYSTFLTSEFRGEWLKQGGSVAVERSFTRAESSFTAHLTALRDAGVEVIYAPIYYNQMVPIAREAAALGIPGERFVGGDGWDADALLRDVGFEMEGAYFTNHYVVDLPWEANKRFVARYKSRYPRDPSSLVALGYDTAKLLADAISRASGDTPQAIRDAVASTRDFDGVTGRLTMGPERDPIKPMVMVRITKRSFRYGAMVAGGKP